jgi:hypothetical membrane protein
MSFRNAGTLLFLGAAQFILALVVAEAIYPGYNVARNYISDLGVGPAAGIFNISIVLLGAAGILASYLIQRASHQSIPPALFLIAGAGAVGVGVFPETMGVIHLIVSVITFLFGGLAAIAAYRFEQKPLNYLSVLLGALALVSLGLFMAQIYLGLGPGGMERMIAYPILLWLLGFGSQLMTRTQETKRTLRSRRN